MRTEEIVDALKDRKPGEFYSIQMRRPGKVRKSADAAGSIEKVSLVTAQLTDYARRSPVREAVENGERDEPELPGHILASKQVGNVRFWEGKNDKMYLPVVVIKSHKPQWYRDGQPCDVADIEEFLLAEETRAHATKEETQDKGQVQFIAVDVRNIERVQ